jgi:hypothetical protein
MFDVWNGKRNGVDVSEAALDRYRRDWSQVSMQSLMSHEPVSMEKILDAASRRIDDMQQKYQRWILARVPQVSFFVMDLGRAFIVDLQSGPCRSIFLKKSVS